MDDVLSQFLVRITYQQDDKSRKDFDEGLRQVQFHAAEFGDKIAALPAIVSEATKRISSSLSELYYAGQKTQATAEQIDALRKAAVQSGEGADNAERSWNSFSETLRKFGDAAGKQLKQIFPDVTDYDPKKKFDSFLKAREEFSREYNAATDEEGKGRVLARGEPFGFSEESAVKGRQEKFNEYFKKQLENNSGIEAEKAAALTRAYNALADALDTVARKADAAVFDKFISVLDRLTKWLYEDSDQIVKFFTDLVTQIGLVFKDLSKLGPAFVFLWDALKEVGGWLQKIIGGDGSGLAGVRHLLEFISGVVMARFALSMAAGFTAAFAPVTALLLALGALGIIGSYFVGPAQASTGGSAGDLGGATGGVAGEAMAGGGSGAGVSSGQAGSGGGGATGAGGAGGGGTGAQGGGGTIPGSGPTGSVYSMIDKASGGDKRVADAMKAIFEGESGHARGVFDVGDKNDGGAYGPFQMNMGGGRLGAQFQKATGLDPRNPENQQAVANWVAKYIKDRPGLNIQSVWHGYQRGLEKIRRGQGHPNDTVMNLSARPDQSPLSRLSGSGAEFHKRLDEIRAAKPSTPWQQSSNEIHDHRAVTNDVNIHVAGGFPVEKTERPLGRPRNADLIRNTASYAA